MVGSSSTTRTRGLALIATSIECYDRRMKIDGAPPPGSPPELPSEKPLTPPQRVAAFEQQLRAFTPRVWVTYAILAANVAVWIAGVATGVHAISPTIDSLLAWGANYGPRTATAHEWWRLVTAVFLHIGLLHLAMNMIVLWSIGRFVERLVGNAGFLVLYLVAGVAGSCLSLAHNPYVVSAGASGAVFGLYGALLGFLLRARGTIPREVLTQLQKSAFLFLFYNLVYGLGQSGIDLAAHLGGLVAGFGGGLVVGHPLDAVSVAGRRRRELTLALAALLVLGGAAAALPRPADWQREVTRFSEMESRTVKLVGDRGKESAAGTLDDRALARALHDAAAEWSAARGRFAAMRGLPAPQAKVRDQLIEYLAARADGWQLYSDGLERNDLALAKRARAQLELSDELAAKVGK